MNPAGGTNGLKGAVRDILKANFFLVYYKSMLYLNQVREVVLCYGAA